MSIYSRHTPPIGFYVYAYLRTDGTPYYIGKGKNSRAFDDHTSHKPPKDTSRIIFLETCLSEIGALAIERRLIRWYGRKDIGTGILRNQTDGGEGVSGYSPTIETRKKYSIRSTGENNGMYGRKHTDQVKQQSSIRRSAANSIRRWYNNGIANKFLIECPAGWALGRLNQKPTTTGNKWFNNGHIAVSRKEKPEGDEWILGMLKR